ncbi:FecR family protein [Thermoflexibacter ruber]|uniref:Ferric-dicitrate binding protein FerR, regulates iron transport through sigma-19 n=1 Tax=Thermoflexibacter ruber TaxID=1003 RepID=A0A1I2DNJ8_9BACT|nr:FecR domain-containing protein [Thermoflexibacter ruber]SFE82008.1 ferric-dicitrate binding protein FerR, regulates iron transport through sigma-19 [Thermoflexibacter ruber]
MKVDPKNLDDFLVANDFASWVKNPTPERNAFWQNWLAENPEHQQRVEQVRLMILMMKIEITDFDATSEEALWQKIQQNTNKLQVSHRKTAKKETKVFNIFSKRHLQIAAAITALLLVSILGLLYLQNPQLKHITAFGETKTITLPDGSKVILNSNSQIEYAQVWEEGTDREVFLKGEAFFQVNKRGTVRKDKFIVHTEGLDVEVLGTEFNVNSYRKKTKVVLQSGKIKLIQTASSQPKEVIMAPGEIAQYDIVTKTLKVREVKTELHTSWKDRKLIFDGTSLRDIAQILEDTYGIKVVLVNKELAERQVTGEIPIKDKELLFKALAAMYNLQIEVKKDSLIISNK